MTDIGRWVSANPWEATVYAILLVLLSPIWLRIGGGLILGLWEAASRVRRRIRRRLRSL